jgi:hypothetical protein
MGYEQIKTEDGDYLVTEGGGVLVTEASEGTRSVAKGKARTFGTGNWMRKYWFFYRKNRTIYLQGGMR